MMQIDHRYRMYRGIAVVALLYTAIILMCAGAGYSQATPAQGALAQSRKLLQQTAQFPAFTDLFGAQGQRQGQQKGKSFDKPQSPSQNQAQDPQAIRIQFQDLFGRQDSQATAAAIATAGSQGRGSASAVSAASAIIEQVNLGKTDAVAQAFADAAARNTAATAAVLAKAAADARSQGAGQAFARSQARAFATARSRGRLDSYTNAVAKAISEADNQDAVVQTYGVAFSQAIASGGDEADALATATAIAFCEGGSTATAFARAYSVALSRDRNGCLVLTKARAIAVARCSGGQFRAFAQASVESQVLGLCGIQERFGLDPDSLRRITSGFQISSPHG